MAQVRSSRTLSNQGQKAMVRQPSMTSGASMSIPTPSSRRSISTSISTTASRKKDLNAMKNRISGNRKLSLTQGNLHGDDLERETSNGKLLVFDSQGAECGRPELPSRFCAGSSRRGQFDPQAFKQFLGEEMHCAVAEVFYLARAGGRHLEGCRAKTARLDDESDWPFVGGMKVMLVEPSAMEEADIAELTGIAGLVLTSLPGVAAGDRGEAAGGCVVS
mmetsp:Transcript_67245/g.173137  ORF Transcript_67245/g.173137 Transcript_67245/m.173137 type:complete len:219 (-) Transcript_67245:33-689(-)